MEVAFCLFFFFICEFTRRSDRCVFFSSYLVLGGIHFSGTVQRYPFVYGIGRGLVDLANQDDNEEEQEQKKNLLRRRSIKQPCGC